MKAIVDIKTIEVDREYFYKETFNGAFPMRVSIDKHPHETYEVTREIIEGKRYILPTGYEVTIGVSDDVFRSLEIPLEALKSDRDMLEDFSKSNSRLRNELSSYKNMKFMDRLKFLFTGKFTK